MAASLDVGPLTVAYSATTVVDRVSFSVPPGGWTCLLGPNGAGKSTVLRAVAGLVPHDGPIQIGGIDITRMRPRTRARQVALVPQSPTLPPDISVEDYVLLGRTAHIPTFGVESAHDRHIVRELVDQLDLAGFERRRLGTLSGGEVQRAVLARALAQEAPVLLLDEPTSALDIGHQQQVLELVARLLCERSLTVVAALHDLTLAAQYADTVVLMDHGKVAATGAPTNVLTSDAVSSLYGADVRVIDVDGNPAVVPVRRFPR